jgi:hypothetical protein
LTGRRHALARSGPASHARLLSPLCGPQTRRSAEMLRGLSSHGLRAPSGAGHDSLIQTAAERRADADQTDRDHSHRGDDDRDDSQSFSSPVGRGGHVQRTQEWAAPGAEASDERARAGRTRLAVAHPGLLALAPLVRQSGFPRARGLALAAQTTLYRGGLSRAVRPV